MLDLLFILVPIGLVIAFISIKSIINFMKIEPIYEMPASQSEGTHVSLFPLILCIFGIVLGIHAILVGLILPMAL